MKSIDYPEANLALAKDQPEYNTLYVHVDVKRPERQMITEYELTQDEIDKIVQTRKIWHSQYTFGDKFQPTLIMVDKPFINPVEHYNPPADENRTSAEQWDLTHFVPVEGADFSTIETIAVCKCANCGRAWQMHYFSSRQCEL